MMRVLVAEDEAVSRLMLTTALTGWGYEVVVTADGAEALRVLTAPAAPVLAVLDWEMPGADGAEICRQVRATPTEEPPYIILLTGRGSKADVVAGLAAGANDYLTKPFDRNELQARLRVGVEVVELRAKLAARVRELEQALAQVRELKGLLPICSYCRKVREGPDYWERLETYVAARTDARFTHGICPACWDEVVVPDALSAGVAEDDLRAK